MKSIHKFAIHPVVAGWVIAYALLPPSVVQAGCIITIAPENSGKISEQLDKDGIPELAGGPEELFGCSQTNYLRYTDGIPGKLATRHMKRVPAGEYRSHTHTTSHTRHRDIARSFGFRYPGFTRVYGEYRYTAPVRVYRGGIYAGSTKTYSGPRFTNSKPGLRGRYTGFSRVYRSHRFTGFSRTYRGPRYPGDVTTTRQTRW